MAWSNGQPQYDDPVLVESEVEFVDIDSDDSIEEVEGCASLSENEDNDYVGEEENNQIFYHQLELFFC